MNKLMVGVGGSGVHSVLAYLHILNLLGEEKIEPIGKKIGGSLLIIDADVDLSSNNTSSTLWNVFYKFYNNKKIEEYLMYPYDQNLVGNNTTFENFLQNLDFGKYFFENEHLSQNISKGFVGKPPIGSTVFYNTLDEIFSADTHSTSLHAQFTSKVESKGQEIMIIIVGSFIGGTGAGVIPALASKIKEQNKNAKLFYIAHGKWFNLVGDEKENIKDKDIEKNASAGMMFLEKNKDSFERIIILDSVNKINRNNDGDKGQKENKDFFYLLAGFLLRGYMKLVGNVQGTSANFFDVCLSVNDNDDSFLERFVIKDSYNNEDEFFSFSTKSNNSFFIHVEIAFYYYWFLIYFLSWMGTGGFLVSQNPINDNIKNYVIKNEDDVKEVLTKRKDSLKYSLNWLLEQKLPEELKRYYKLPYNKEKIESENNVNGVNELVDYLDNEIFSKKFSLSKIVEELEISETLQSSSDFEKKLWKSFKNIFI